MYAEAGRPVMRKVPVLCSIVLLVCASSAVAQEADIRGTYPDEGIDEIVVVGTNLCGSWPIEHYRLTGCEYLELKKEELPMVLRARQEFFSDCLKCLGSRCTMKAWPEDRVTEKLICKRLFRTPTRVSRFMKPDALFNPFRVTFTFDISIEGKVEDIELVSFEGDIEKEELLRLIGGGAARTRFEPIVVADVAYELVGLNDTFILDD
jgi:hypothetical protein